MSMDKMEKCKEYLKITTTKTFVKNIEFLAKNVQKNFTSSLKLSSCGQLKTY